MSSTSPKLKTIENRVRAMIQDALRYHESELSRFRIKAGRYYRGEGFGDEEEGRSKIVLTEVRDAVLQQMPSLMRVFFGPDGVVEFVARRPEAVDLAEQQTDYINHLFVEDNPGFFVAYSAFKDALVRRVGIIKWRWEKKDVIESERLSGVSDEELQAMLSEEPKLELQNTEKNDDGTLTVEVRRKVSRGRARIEAVPPEEFIYNRSARSIEDAVFVAHVTTTTVGELVAMGYKKSELDGISQHALLVPSQERDARRPRGASSYEADESNSGENTQLSYVEAYVRMDFGEGIEHKKMCFAGAELKLINTEPAPERPFAVFTPDPEPHEIQGLGLTDMAADLQLINSHVARGILNSLNLSLNPRTIYNPDLVNVKDMMNVEIGALIRSEGDVNVSTKELVHPFVGSDGLGVLEFFRGVKEERLGQTRASAGLNPDALQSAGKEAVDATISKAEARTELMARVFAEGMKTLFKGLYNLVRRHQDEPRVIRLRGQYVKVDPRMWPPDPDVSVRVGIGGGTKQDKLAFIAATIEKQEQVMQILGPNSILTDLKRYRNMLAEGLRMSGYDPSKAWKEVTDEQIQQMEQAAAAQPEQQQADDPATMLAQAQVENEKMSLENARSAKEAEIMLKQMELELKREEMVRQDDRERDKLDADIALRAKELELKYQAAVDTAQIKAQLERDRENVRQETEIAKEHIAANAVPETEPGIA